MQYISGKRTENDEIWCSVKSLNQPAILCCMDHVKTLHTSLVHLMFKYTFLLLLNATYEGKACTFSYVNCEFATDTDEHTETHYSIN